MPHRVIHLIFLPQSGLTYTRKKVQNSGWKKCVITASVHIVSQKLLNHVLKEWNANLLSIANILQKGCHQNRQKSLHCQEQRKLKLLNLETKTVHIHIHMPSTHTHHLLWSFKYQPRISKGRLKWYLTYSATVVYSRSPLITTTQSKLHIRSHFVMCPEKPKHSWRTYLIWVRMLLQQGT